MKAYELYKKETGKDAYKKETKTDKWGEFPVEIEVPTLEYIWWLEVIAETHNQSLDLGAKNSGKSV